MIPISELQSCYAEELKHGDFAYLPTISNTRALVGKAHDETLLAVLLDLPDDGMNFAEVRDINGPALRVPGVNLEVDPTTQLVWDRSSASINAILARGKAWHVIARSLRGPFPIAIGELTFPMPTGFDAVFPHWRLVAGTGDERRVLFEKGP